LKYNINIKYNFVFLIIFFSISCNDLYKAGNSNPSLNIEIETNINQDVAFKFLDTSRDLIQYELPSIYNEYLKSNGDLKYLPYSNKVIFFKNYPEEAFHLSSSGILFLQQIYNTSIGGSNWVFDKNNLTDKDFLRFEKRIDTFLNKIVDAERKNNLPDSIIFLKEPYDTIICKLLEK
jgi:hypothetical protein